MQEGRHMEYKTIRHTFTPVFDENSQILILGSLPSVKSRENGFYYGHPQNRFWKVLAALFHSEVPASIPDKKEFLLKNRIALWDVIAQCDIRGSSDSSVKNVVPNDISIILEHAQISEIYTNGNKAFELYEKYCYPLCGRKAVRLPSTSPANAAYRTERLIESWGALLQTTLYVSKTSEG
jgi:hypoxanthine-DNA glycosylase